MSELLSKLNGGEIIGLVAVGGAMLVGLVSVLGGYWRHGRLIALKQDMVNRGMSADEIQAVLAAGSGERHRCRKS